MVFQNAFLLGLIQSCSVWFQLSHESLFQVSGAVALRLEAVLDCKCVRSQ